MPDPATTIQIRFPVAPRPAQWRSPPTPSPAEVIARGTAPPTGDAIRIRSST